jgi:hypothetical protein
MAGKRKNARKNAADTEHGITSGKLEELPNHPDYTDGETAPPAGHIVEGDGSEENPNRVVREPRW